MKCSRIIHQLLAIFTLMWLTCSIKAEAVCSKQLGKDAFTNPQVPIQGQDPVTCTSFKTCCSRRLEATLQQQSVREMHSKIVKRLNGVKGSTVSIEQDIRGFFKEIVKSAKTESLQTLKKSHANFTRIGWPLVSTLFNQIESSIHNHKTNFTSIVLQLFKDSFPPLFNYATSQSKRFSKHYEKCLRDNANYRQLYGANLDRNTMTLSKVMIPIQTFLHGLTFAEKSLESAAKLNFTLGCSRILLQMEYCSKCNGEDDFLKPCETYCVDVLKNCLVTSQGKLQKQWELFFEAMGSLAKGLSTSMVKERLYEVYDRLSMDVMVVIPQVALPHVKVPLNKRCGPPTFAKHSPSPNANIQGIDSQNVKSVLSLKEKMRYVQIKMKPLKEVFEDMPRDVCVNDKVSALRSDKVIVAKCWNGTGVGRYNGPVSSPLPSLDSQPGDRFRTDVLVRDLEKMIVEIKKNTPDYAPTEIDGSGGSGSGESGCNSDDEDCSSGESGEGSTDGNTIYGNGFGPTPFIPGENDFSFITSNPVQDGGINDQKKSKNTANVLSLTPFLLLTSLVLLLRI